MNSLRHRLDELDTLKPQSHLQPASPPSPLLTIYTLGRFAVYRADELIEDSVWKRRKAKNLFKLLLLAPDYQLLKDRALEWLWPDLDPERAANNLHRTLFILRRVLQPNLDNAADSHYVQFKDGTLKLNQDSIAWVDFEEFEHRLRLARQQDDLAQYKAARMLYQGDFLPEDLYEDWASEYRERLRHSYSMALQQMAQRYAEGQAFSEAVDCLEELLGIEAANEEACRELMRLHASTGQRHQALRLYDQVSETLQQELEVEPSSETTALYQAIAEDKWQPASEVTNALLVARPATDVAEIKPRPLFVGREAEIKALEAQLNQVDAGRGSVVILSGEQGVGKTRLAEETIKRARAAGMQILHGAAYEQEGHLPYGPFVELIRAALAGQSSKAVREKLGGLTKDLARLLPELAGSSPPASTQLDLEIGQERQRLFDAVTTIFLILAQNARLVLCLDDLHAAGESSLQLLHYLARQITDAPILILCTVREEETQRGTPIARFCSQLVTNRLGQRLKLGRLSPTESASLCSDLLDGASLHPGLCDALYQLTEGNPFFIQALVLALLESGKLERENGYWHFPANERLAIPASVQEAIGLRLERLSEEAYRLIGLASVIGREFSYDILRATAQWNGTILFDLLDELLAAYLIEETEVGYRFQHGLIRQAIYDELALHRRAWLHGQVAQAMEQLTARKLDERVAILAYHYERAENFEIAVRYLVRAGDRAQTTYAPREALDHYNQALVLHRRHPEVVTHDTLAELLKRRAQTHLALSDFDAAIGDLEQLLEDNYYRNNQLRRGEILYQLGIAHYWAHRLEQATHYLDEAIQLAMTFHLDELRTRALKLRDILNSTQGNMGQVTRVPSSPADSNDSLLAEEHWGQAMLAHLRSDFGTARQHAQACVELGQSLGNTFLMLGGYFVLGMSNASLACYQIALDDLTYALELSEATGESFWRARLLNTIGWVYRELFNLEQAIEYDQASLELARSSQPRLTEAEGNALANLATDYLLQKDYKQTRAILDEGLQGFQNEPFMRWRYRTRMIIINGRLALTEGNIKGALAAADESLVVARNTRARKNIARSCRLRGEALVAAQRVTRARAALRHALYVSLSVKSPALIWPCYLALAEFEEEKDNLNVARMYYLGAAQILYQISSELTKPALFETFLAAAPVQLVFSKAVCPLRLAPNENQSKVK